MAKRSATGGVLKSVVNRRKLLGSGGAAAAGLAVAANTPMLTRRSTAAPAVQTPTGTVTLVHPQTILTLDPNIGVVQVVRSVTGHMYDSVVELTADAQLRPMLAESWSALGPNTWEIKLRRGVKFHDGSPFNAEVLKFTIERILNPEYNSLQRTFWVPVVSITTPDEYTCVIETETPMGTMPYVMALTSPVHPDVGTDPQGFPEHPIGTGPFKFVEWEKDDRVVMEAFDEYWDGPPQIEQVVFRTIPELSTRMSALEAGEVDIVFQVVPEDAGRLEATGEIEVQRVETFRTNWLWMNGQRKPFDDVRVRQAIQHAVNMDVIAESIIKEVGVKARAPIAPKVFGFNPNLPPYEHNPDKAKALLADAGFPNGFETTLLGNPENEVGSYTRSGDVALVILAQLEEVGIRVEPIEPVPGSGALLELDWDMVFAGTTAVTGDADYGMGRLYLCSANRTGWCNDEVDRLLLTARQSIDQEERRKAYQEAQVILWREGPSVWTYHTIDLVGVRRGVEGFEARPDQLLSVRHVSLEG